MLALALLIDGENVPAGMLPRIESHLAGLGEPIVKCVFGDFSNNRLGNWLAVARKHGLETVFQISGGKGKNTVDIALTIRAMELLQAGHIEGFCLASSDRDFIPLAAKLRQHGKKVYGFGEADKADPISQNNFTRFFTLATTNSAAKSGVPSPVKTPAKTPAKVCDDAQERRIAEIFRKTGKADAHGHVHLSVLATTMRREAPDLAEKLCGKGKFLKNLRLTGKIHEIGAGGAICVRWRDEGAAATN